MDNKLKCKIQQKSLREPTAYYPCKKRVGLGLFFFYNTLRRNETVAAQGVFYAVLRGIHTNCNHRTKREVGVTVC